MILLQPLYVSHEYKKYSVTFPNSELEYVGSSWKGKQVIKNSNKAIEDDLPFQVIFSAINFSIQNFVPKTLFTHL